VSRRSRPGWEKARPNVKGWDWILPSRWEVRHCGHPTASWPFYLLAPGGSLPIVSFNGYGFAALAVAQEVAERLARGELAWETVDGVALVPTVTATGDPAP